MVPINREKSTSLLKATRLVPREEKRYAAARPAWPVPGIASPPLFGFHSTPGTVLLAISFTAKTDQPGSSGN